MKREGKEALPSVFASVPFIATSDIEAAIPRMLDHIRDMLEKAQDGIIRSLYGSTNGAASVVTDDDISVDACTAYLETKAAGTRLSAESVNAWFASTAKDYVIAFIADKLRFTELTPDNLKVCEQHANGYCGLLQVLAGGKTILPANQLKTLRIVLYTLGEDNAMASRLLEKITAMEAPKRPKVQELLS